MTGYMENRLHMASMHAYAYITDAPDTVSDVAHTNITRLAPFDQIKVLLEQFMYASFLRYLGIYSVAQDLESNVTDILAAIPARISTGQEVLDTQYNHIHHFVRACYSRDPQPVAEDRVPPSPLSEAEILVIFNQPNAQEYHLDEYTPTIQESFVHEWAGLFLEKGDDSAAPLVAFTNAPIYAPTVEKYRDYAPNGDGYVTRLRICISPVMIANNFAANRLAQGLYDGPCAYLSKFDLSAQASLSDLIPLLANYSLVPTEYAMTDSRHAALPAYCRDLITGGNHTEIVGSYSKSEASFDFIALARFMVENSCIRPAVDYSLLAELLQRLDEDPKVIDYLKKPVEEITAAEAFSFRHSLYASLLRDKFTARPGLAALEDEDNEDTSGEDAAPVEDEAVTDEDDGTDDDSGDLGMEEDTAPVDTGEDEQADADAAAARPKPRIDPNQMLLELAKPGEPLSDYLFKEMVARRISAILRNPPENAMPNDLLMLKRWRSRWLFLVSIGCVRDFLTRISLRLSDN